MEKRKGTITSDYRKMAMKVEAIEEKAGTIKANLDIVLMLAQIFWGGLIAVCGLFILLYAMYNWSFIEENIPGGLKTFTASLISLLAAIYAEYKTFIIAMHTDHGEIKSRLVEKARKPKEQIDTATGLSIPSTEIMKYIPPNTTYRNVQATEIKRQGDGDVVFESEQKNG